jgi:DNA-binding transcriptional ArsR family regulator
MKASQAETNAHQSVIHDVINRLDRTFHAPARLAIMCRLRSVSPSTFQELKQSCGLTDGNLNRHLAVLRQQKAITVSKAIGMIRPKTVVVLTPEGHRLYSLYISALKTIVDESTPRQATVQKRERPARTPLLPATNPLPNRRDMDMGEE